MSSKCGIKSILLSALLGSMVSQAAYAAATLSTTTSTITIRGVATKVYTISSDGTPYYGTNGAAGFPAWSAYLHTPAAVSHTYYVPASPVLAGTAAAPKFTPVGLANDSGVALDGIPFDALTSNCNGTATATNTCTFRLEGRLQYAPGTKDSYYTAKRLGFDTHNGHSQSNPNAYHYHGIPCGIVTASGGSALFTCTAMSSGGWASLPSAAKIVGYARDGYPIVVKAGVYSSYSVVTAANALSTRPATSKNTVDTTNAYGNWSKDMNTLVTSGTTFLKAAFPVNTVAGDFKYTGPDALGTSTSALGRCNETANTDTSIKTLAGATAAYAYYLTPNYPMVPRCLIGLTDGATENTQGFYHAGSSD